MAKKNLLSTLRTAVAVAGIGLAGLVAMPANAGGERELAEEFLGRINRVRANYNHSFVNHGEDKPVINIYSINPEKISEVVRAIEKAPLSTQRELSEVTICSSNDFLRMLRRDNGSKIGGSVTVSAFAYDTSIILKDDSDNKDFTLSVLHELGGHNHENAMKKNPINYLTMTEEWKNECSDKNPPQAVFASDSGYGCIWKDQYDRLREFQRKAGEFNSSNAVLNVRGREFQRKIENGESVDGEEIEIYNLAAERATLEGEEFRKEAAGWNNDRSAPRSSYITAYASTDPKEDRAELTAYAIEKPEVVRNHLLTTDPKSAELLKRKLAFLQKWKYIDSETYEFLTRPKVEVTVGWRIPK